MRPSDVVLALCVLALAGGCRAPDALTRIERNRTAWDALRPNQYVFEYQRTCFCRGRGAWWRVTVQGDSVVGVALADTGAARGNLVDGLRMRHPTIDELFDEISRDAQRQPDRLVITYHPLWHSPVEIDIDPHTTSFGDEWQVSIRGVRPVFTFGGTLTVPKPPPNMRLQLAGARPSNE